MSKKPYPTRKRTGHSIESAAVSDTRQTNTTSTLARVWKINPTAPKGSPPQCTRVSNTPASCSTELVTSLCKRLQEQCILPRLPVSVLPSALPVPPSAPNKRTFGSSHADASHPRHPSYELCISIGRGERSPMPDARMFIARKR
jgi:hypothetical protein